MSLDLLYTIPAMDALSKRTAELIFNMHSKGEKSPYCVEDKDLKRQSNKDKKISLDPIRHESVIDIQRILNIPFYNRYYDKTQVFSLFKNDDITRRGLHVQLVSRASRDIGDALGLNLNLIEAIALGHDLGHTPFGHLGEDILDRIDYEFVGRHFMHNVHSVRVLYNIFPVDISIQTLSGIIAHNGEFALPSIEPYKTGDEYVRINTFEELDIVLEQAYKQGPMFTKKVVPATLEAAVVRFSDMIAYIGKDRHDAKKVNKTAPPTDIDTSLTNSNFIKSITEDLVENSLNKPYIALSKEGFELIKTLKRENYAKIYANADTHGQLGDAESGTLRTLFEKLYHRFYKDLEEENTLSPIYKHHLSVITNIQKKKREYTERYFKDRSKAALSQIVVDFIASMTDDYFIDVARLIFPEHKLEYIGYFSDNNNWDEYLRRAYEYN